MKGPVLFQILGKGRQDLNDVKPFKLVHFKFHLRPVCPSLLVVALVEPAPRPAQHAPDCRGISDPGTGTQSHNRNPDLELGIWSRGRVRNANIEIVNFGCSEYPNGLVYFVGVPNTPVDRKVLFCCLLTPRPLRIPR